MSERIQPKNNRTFTTGSGSWAGDLVYHGDIFLGKHGYISLELDPTPAPKTISLHYPYVKPIPNKDNTLVFAVHFIQPSTNGFALTFELTDGVYSHSLYVENFFDSAGAWDETGDDWILEPDWDIENTTLLITASLISDPSAELGFDDFSLTAETPRADHLPLMGVH